jgi:hypothetical protein
MIQAVLLVTCTAAATRNVTVGDATLEILTSPLPGRGDADEYHGIGSVFFLD